jgi:hypothetical protein
LVLGVSALRRHNCRADHTSRPDDGDDDRFVQSHQQSLCIEDRTVRDLLKSPLRVRATVVMWFSTDHRGRDG